MRLRNDHPRRHGRRSTPAHTASRARPCAGAGGGDADAPARVLFAHARGSLRRVRQARRRVQRALPRLCRRVRRFVALREARARLRRRGEGVACAVFLRFDGGVGGARVSLPGSPRGAAHARGAPRELGADLVSRRRHCARRKPARARGEDGVRLRRSVPRARANPAEGTGPPFANRPSSPPVKQLFPSKPRYTQTVRAVTLKGFVPRPR
mmetsp:Transcript_3455/g.12395  ORF Transcript_3455/g.12395 Transcript_3455/m.12395 type:complete len:210 (-) Transcript_3455:550-1179(-)